MKICSRELAKSGEERDERVRCWSVFWGSTVRTAVLSTKYLSAGGSRSVVVFSLTRADGLCNPALFCEQSWVL